MPQFKVKLMVILSFTGCAMVGCKPLIYSFDVRPLTITAHDSIRVNWSVRGKPTLLIHTGSTDQPGFELREYSLVVEKNGKQAGRRAVVNVLPALSADMIEFDCERKGDTLIAIGEKNKQRWGDYFTLRDVRSFSGRPLWVSHGGRSAALPADSSISAIFSGLSNSGPWEIKTLLTPEEKKDPGSLPGSLQVQTMLIFKK